MNITAGMVKDLREMTGAGMMDCKKALAECDGNMDEAIEFLRKKGLAAAEKKASRIAAEGICDTCISEDGKIAAEGYTTITPMNVAYTDAVPVKVTVTDVWGYTKEVKVSVKVKPSTAE